jgi:riboflavin biosynthesis pyrimidine reductase
VKYYSLTKLGRKVSKTKSGSSDEMKVINFLADNKPASDDELDIVVEGGHIVVKNLVRDKLVVELNG